jgi:hypothetical protein
MNYIHSRLMNRNPYCIILKIKYFENPGVVDLQVSVHAAIVYPGYKSCGDVCRSIDTSKVCPSVITFFRFQYFDEINYLLLYSYTWY